MDIALYVDQHNQKQLDRRVLSSFIYMEENMKTWKHYMDYDSKVELNIGDIIQWNMEDSLKFLILSSFERNGTRYYVTDEADGFFYVNYDRNRIEFCYKEDLE